jgi:phage shock protein A
MFQDWKKAWREAVDNFRREVAGAEEGGDSRTRAMQRELNTARVALEKLEGEIRRTRREAGEERESEAVCRRREEMARRIGDEETVRIAVEFCARHAERAGVLERKGEVLVEERALLVRDLESMEQTIAAQPDAPRVTAAGPRTPGEALEDEGDREARDFGRLEKEARERAAAEKLEELKRRMR